MATRGTGSRSSSAKSAGGRSTRATASAASGKRSPSGRGSSPSRRTSRAASSSSRTLRSASRKPFRFRIPLTPGQRAWVGGLLLFAGACVALLGLLAFPNEGYEPRAIHALRRVLGWAAYVAPLLPGAAGVWLVLYGAGRTLRVPWLRLLGMLLVLAVALALTGLLVPPPAAPTTLLDAGGSVGRWMATGLAEAFGRWGAVVVSGVAALAGVSMLVDVSMADIVGSLRRLVGTVRRRLRSALPADRPLAAQITLPDRAATGGQAVAGAPPPAASRLAEPAGAPAQSVKETERPAANPAPREMKVRQRAPRPEPQNKASRAATDEAFLPAVGDWSLPRAADILADYGDTRVDVAALRTRARVIEETLLSLGVPVSVVEVNPGPTVTQFGLEPGYTERKDRQGNVARSKVKVSAIERLANDLALALAASSIRIEAPVPGKPVVGVEVPNPEPATVGLRGVMESDEFRENSAPLLVALGRDVAGDPVVADLARLPHLLIAGATGTGKSVCINALIASLLCRNTPETLRLLMVDPKRVELSGYDGIPHLVAPVVVDMTRVVGVLQWLLREMDRRYELLAQSGARNIDGYNKAVRAAGGAEEERQALPYIICIVDELADLMMVASDEVERNLCRLAQMARATGIHLVVATQRPSVDVITGLIKANFPARISFAVSSLTDSRVVLDTPGAEKLLGRGDGLYMAPDSPLLQRIQGSWVSTEELNGLVVHWKRQKAEVTPGSLPRFPSVEQMVQQPLWPDGSGGVTAEPAGGDDALLQQAIDLVRQQGRASVSMLQRSMRIGYSRASRLIDTLEERGIVGPAQEGSRPREVLDVAGDQKGDDIGGA